MRRGAVLAVTLGLVLGIGAGGAGGVDTYRGTIGDRSPSMEGIAPLEGPGCGEDLGQTVHYDVVTLAHGAGGAYVFELTSTNLDFAAMYLYEVRFDPSDPGRNCIASASFGDPVTLRYDLVEATPYSVVVWDDTLDQVGGDYTLTVTPPPPGATRPAPAGPPASSVDAPTAPPVRVQPAFTG